MGRGFKGLIAWQRSKALAVRIYRLTEQGKWTRDYGLRDQIRRAAVSVPSNIAEGDERDGDGDSARFFRIAKGSLAEVRTQLEIAFEIGYLADGEFQPLDNECDQIAHILGALIRARQPALTASRLAPQASRL